MGLYTLGLVVLLLPLVGAFCSRNLSSVLLLTISVLAVLLGLLCYFLDSYIVPFP